MDGILSKHKSLNISFDDFEEFAHVIKQWDLDLQQLDSGPFRADLLQITSEDFQASKGKFSRKLDQKGIAPKGLNTFAILTDTSTPFTWYGEYADQQKILMFPNDGELDGFSEPGFDILTISFTDDLLYNTMEIVGVDSTRDILGGSAVTNSDPKKVALIRKTVSNLLSELTLKTPRMTEAQIQYEIEYEIPRAIILAFDKKSFYEMKPSPRSRYLAIRRVREYLESNSFEDITVRDLCRVACVSERTLRYAFEEYLGVSPAIFIKMFRLNRVRRDLRNTNHEDKNISDIANRWGFWHMGKFAADYRKLFGELPSETDRGIRFTKL